MHKIRNIAKYIDTIEENKVFFKNYYFHALIDLNLVKMDSILQNGILSKKLIEQKNLIDLYTHDERDFDSKNGNSYISLTEYRDHCEFNPMFDSFSCHTLTSISLLVDKSISVAKDGERRSYFDDEVFYPNLIPKSQIEGIILPEHLSELLISQVNCLPNDISCYTREYLNHWIQCMQLYFKKELSKQNISDIKNGWEQLWSILEEYESPERWIQSAIRTQHDQYGKDLKDILANILHNLWSEKFGLYNPKYMDILMQINENNLPVYEIKQKCLKRIN